MFVRGPNETKMDTNRQELAKIFANNESGTNLSAREAEICLRTDGDGVGTARLKVEGVLALLVHRRHPRKINAACNGAKHKNTAAKCVRV